MTAPLASDQLERIAEELQQRRDDLERLAASDTAFAERAKAALDWLDEYQDGQTSGDPP